jgi:hypothetical protein
VRGLLPVEVRDADGKLVRDDRGSVQLSPRFKRGRIRGAQWIDEVILSVAQLLSSKHTRVLLALHAMTNALKHDDIVTFAHFDDETGKVIADDGSTDGTCGYSMPTLCVRIPDLSFDNVSRFLHPNKVIVLDRLREDAERSDLPFNAERAEVLLRDDGIVEAEFWQIVDDLTGIGALAVLDQEGRCVGLLNHVSMAQCTPSMRLTILQGVSGAVMHPSERRTDHTVSGVLKPDSKKRDQGNRAQRERIGELAASNKRKDRAMEKMEQDHAEDRAKMTAERDAAQAKIAALQAEATAKDARIAQLERALRFEHGAQGSDASTAVQSTRKRRPG